MDLKVPEPIRVEQVAIKVEELESNDTQLFSAEPRICTKQEPAFYSEEEDIEDDDDVLEECDVLIQHEPNSHMLKDPLSIDDEDLSKKSNVIKEEPSDASPNLTGLHQVITSPPNPTVPMVQNLKTVQVAQNLMLLVLNQQIFAVGLPSGAAKDQSKFKLIVQPSSFKSNGVVTSSPPKLTPIIANNESNGLKSSTLQMLLCSTDKKTDKDTLYLYKCIYCNLRCKGKIELLQHMLESHKDCQQAKLHSSPYIFKCYYCSGRCKTRFDLHKHMIETHYPKTLGGYRGNSHKVQVLHPKVNPAARGLAKYKKPTCLFDGRALKTEKQNPFLIQKDFTSNIYQPEQDITNYIFICYYCNGRSSNKKELEQHILLTHIPHLGRASPKTSNVKPVISVPKPRRKPRAKKQQSAYQCSYCSYQAPRPCMIRDHTAAKHTFEKPYKCELCDYRSSSRGLVLGHIKAKHGEKQFKCDQCDYKATQLCKVKYHIEAKHCQLKKYKCPKCDYRAVHAAGLRGHVITQHEKKRTFHCPFCGYMTRHASCLQIHVLSKHTKDRPFRCQQCDYGAVTARNLKYHMMTKHTLERPFPCQQCSYKAVLSNSLKKHIESKHLELKQYCCEHCDYKSSRPLVVKKHVQSKHLGEKPFQCFHCGYATVWMGNLKIHIRSKHNKDTWYKCLYCYFRTFVSKNLKRHIKTNHMRKGKIIIKPKRGRGRPRGSGKPLDTGRPRGSGKPLGTGRPRGRPRKIPINLENNIVNPQQ